MSLSVCVWAYDSPFYHARQDQLCHLWKRKTKHQWWLRMQATESGENLPTQTRGESPSCLPLLQTAVYFIDFIYWVGQKFQLGFAIPSYGKTWMNFSFFFFFIDKRWIYLQRDTLHRQSMGRAEGKSDLGGNTLHRSTGRCRKQQQPRLNVKSA